MILNLVDDKKQPLLARRNVSCQIEFDGPTPSRKEITKQISESLKVREDLVLISKIDTQFGFRKALVDAQVYDNEKSLKMYVPKHIFNRGKAKGNQSDANVGAEAKETEAVKEPEKAASEQKVEQSAETKDGKEKN